MLKVIRLNSYIVDCYVVIELCCYEVSWNEIYGYVTEVLIILPLVVGMGDLLPADP